MNRIYPQNRMRFIKMLKVNNRYSELCPEDSQYFTMFQPSFKPVLNTQILHTLQLQVSLKYLTFCFGDAVHKNIWLHFHIHIQRISIGTPK